MKQEVSYIDQINAFERWLETSYLSTGSQLLWYKLLVLFNRSRWNEWVTVDNRRLMSLMQVNREATFLEWRNSLIDAGLLQYKKGKKGSPNQYKMNFFTFKSEVNRVVQNDCTFKSEVNRVVQPVVQTEVQTVVQTVDIVRLRQDKDKDKENGGDAPATPPTVSPPNEIGELIAYANAKGILGSGRMMASEIEYFLSRSMTAEMVRYAVDEAANGGKPWVYVKGILTAKLRDGILDTSMLQRQENQHGNYWKKQKPDGAAVGDDERWRKGELY